MSEWVMALSVGPVAAFIAGGRRSRDLWWGSTWVSECTWTVADLLQKEDSVRLVVPSARRVAQVRTQPDRYRRRISNRILAIVSAPDSAAVAELARRCERAAHDQLVLQLTSARRSLNERGAKLQRALEQVLLPEIFADQVTAVQEGDFIEIFAAWAPVAGAVGKAIERVNRLLDSRKTARLFSPPRSEPGRRKSDLDPGRDSVLIGAQVGDREATPAEAATRQLARRILGINPDENLDAIGFARRISVFRRDSPAPVSGPALGRLPFPPISRVAADPWLRRAAMDPETAGALAEIKEILEEAKSEEIFFTWCSPARDPEIPADAAVVQSSACFPFDASLLMEGGLEALEQEVRRIGERLHGEAAVASALSFLHRLGPPVRHLHRIHGSPPPYYALLMMDGDGVGLALEAARHEGDLQELVAALDDYADGAEEIVRRDCFGCAFYVGGDDLAAYLPVDTALKAVRSLAEHFSASVQPSFLPAPLTLSGGLVIAHAKADLRAVRRQCQLAQRQAKERRARQPETLQDQPGWLAVVELPRSGSPRSCFGPLPRLIEDLELWQDLLRGGRLSPRSPRLLLRLEEDLADRDLAGGGDTGLELVPYRLIAQAERSGQQEIPQLAERLWGIREWEGAVQLAHELIIAPRFQRAADLRPGTPGRGV